MPGMPAEAVEAAETALRLNPKPPASALLTAGLALFLDEQYDRAIEALEQARDLAPGLNEPHRVPCHGLCPGRATRAGEA